MMETATVIGRDGIKWYPRVKVVKYNEATLREIIKVLKHEPSGPELRWLEEHEGLVPDEITEGAGNLLVTTGVERLVNLITGGGAQAFNNSRAVVGVGTSTTTATVADVHLGNDGTANAYYQGADATYPSVTGTNGVISVNSTFTASNANFAWNEWAVGVATAAVVAGTTFATVSTTGVLLNHAIQTLGTKVSPAVWTLQATITLS